MARRTAERYDLTVSNEVNLLNRSRIAWLLILLVVALAQPGIGQKLEDNTNRFGQDFRDFDLSEPDPQACLKACADDEQCRAFTYLKPYGWPGAGPTAHCWLKSAIPAAKNDACCVSGVVRPEKPVQREESAPQQEPQPTGKPGDWKVDLSASGGIAPMRSFLSVTSDGHFRRLRRGSRDTEEGTVPSAAFEKLQAAVRAARLSTWKQSYNRPGDDGCCDRVSTGLSVDVCGADGKWTRYQGHWYSPVEQPADLRAVLAAMNF